MPNILFLIIPIVAINTILLVLFLAKKISQRQPESQQSEQQTEGQATPTPTPTTPRKLPIGKAIALILVIAIPLGIFFLYPGDTNDKIEKAKSVIPREAPAIPVFADNFSRQELGENWRLETNNWVIENGELIGQKGNSGSAWIDLNCVFEADKLIIEFDAWIKSKEWKPETEIGLYIDDGSKNYYPQFIFDGQTRICLQSENNPYSPFDVPLKSNKVYHITVERIEQRKEIQLSFVVTDKNGIIGTDSKRIENKGKERIKMGFVSFNIKEISYENNNNRIHVDNLKIYT